MITHDRVIILQKMQMKKALRITLIITGSLLILIALVLIIGIAPLIERLTTSHYWIP